MSSINAGEGVEKREASYTVGGNANRYSHYGEQCGDSIEKNKTKLETELPHDPAILCWAYTPKIAELKETHGLQCSLLYCAQ